jgi:hypothetical protein
MFIEAPGAGDPPALAALCCFGGLLFQQAIEWMCAQSPRSIYVQREAMIRKLEAANQKMHASGLCDSWFGSADQQTRAVTAGVNGHLWSVLLRASDYVDPDCVDLLRQGVLLVVFLHFLSLYPAASVRCLYGW